MADRSRDDGKPYYCVKCGAGWNEYGACEEVDCELETAENAELRRDRLKAQEDLNDHIISKQP